MVILIIENEYKSAEQLKGFISAVKKECSFLPLASSIQESLAIVSTATPDVIFMNINLSDHKGFDLFRKATIMAPIIYTTSNDHKLPGTMENGDIIYIMNPFHKNMVEDAFSYLEKNIELRNLPSRLASLFPGIERVKNPSHKTRFLVRHGHKLIPLKSAEINHFASEDSLVYVVTLDKRRYVVDESLNELDILLNPADFFRVNRKFIIAKDSILSLDYFSKGQVVVKAKLLESERIVVSRQQTPVLKAWLSQ